VSLNQIILAVAILSAGIARADISDAYRNANAVVNYDFAKPATWLWIKELIVLLH